MNEMVIIIILHDNNYKSNKIIVIIDDKIYLYKCINLFPESIFRIYFQVNNSHSCTFQVRISVPYLG